MSHTPGPWQQGKAKDRLYDRILVPGKEGMYTDIICYVNGLLPNIDEDEYLAYHPGAAPQAGFANARLIAAAPDLLEACEKALNLISNTGFNAHHKWDGFESMLRAAIAKAKGEE